MGKCFRRQLQPNSKFGMRKFFYVIMQARSFVRSFFLLLQFPAAAKVRKLNCIRGNPSRIIQLLSALMDVSVYFLQ